MSIICEVRKKLELENEKKLITKSNKYKLNEKSKKNNPLLIQGNIQTKVGLYKFITAIISQQTKDLHNDINKELSQFYKALKERGDISIYE